MRAHVFLVVYCIVRSPTDRLRVTSIRTIYPCSNDNIIIFKPSNKLNVPPIIECYHIVDGE